MDGRSYLRNLQSEYSAYIQFLSIINDSSFQHQKKINQNRFGGVESFLADFAIAAEETRRNIVRWQTGSNKLPQLSPEQIETIIKTLPPFVCFDKEALGGMSVRQVSHHPIDILVDQIMLEISKRLSRKIDAYRYHQDYAYETINIKGIGDIKVTLHESTGVFQSISSIQTDKFKIWNCRDSGVIYLDNFIEISRPSEVIIKPLKLELNIYSDRSGDETRDPKKFQQNQERAIIWLVDNVLNQLKSAPLPKYQADTIPMELPYPEGAVGPLYAFVDETSLKKVAILQQNGVQNAYPHERVAVSPSNRLIPLNYSSEGLPSIVHDGYIWCGVGMIGEVIKQKNPMIADHERDNWSMTMKEGIAEIKPLTATDIYVIDWQAWEDFRTQAFKPGHDRLTDIEVREMFKSVARTLVPITEYKGNYKQPIVLISRDLEVSEIGKTHIFPRS